MDNKFLTSPSRIDSEEEGVVKLQDTQIDLWDFESRFRKYISESNDQQVLEIFTSATATGEELQAQFNSLDGRIAELMNNLEDAAVLDVSMLQDLYRYQRKHVPSFSLQRERQDLDLATMLLEQKQTLECGIGGIQKMLSIVCEKTITTKEYPEEWKLVSHSKKTFTEWKNGEAHKIFKLGTDKTPYGSFIKFWVEITPDRKHLFISLFHYISNKLKNVSLLTAGMKKNLFSIDNSMKYTTWLFYSCLYDLVDFVDCLSESKDCSGNPLFRALELKSDENKELMKEFVQSLIEELHKDDLLFKKRSIELDTMIAKNKEAEKQDLLLFGRTDLDDNEKILNEMYSRIGINRRLEKYSDARTGEVQKIEDPDEIIQSEAVEAQAQLDNGEYQVNDIDDNAYDHDQQNPEDTDEL